MDIGGFFLGIKRKGRGDTVLSLDLAHRLIFNKVLPLPSGKEST
jgi:hypothetical protein